MNDELFSTLQPELSYLRIYLNQIVTVGQNK